MNITNIPVKIQQKLRNYTKKHENNFKKPEYKFISDAVSGMITSRSIFLSRISSNLNEVISVKKTEERLSYHLEKDNMFNKIISSHISSNKRRIGNQKYIIFDGSDITKSKYRKMEGLAAVRDGSKSSKKLSMRPGYYWENVIGANDSNDKIFPIYSEIFSRDLDCEYKISENRKILSIYDTIKPSLSSSSVLVMDRGYDRRTLITPFLEKNQQFIIRQVGRRHLIFNNTWQALKKIYKETDFKHYYKVQTNNHGKKRVRNFNVGALKVEFPDFSYNKKDKQLWLITSKESGKGYSWFLAYLDTFDEKKAIDITMNGYKNRWKIEEFHRQVKQDYNLEKIKYIKYNKTRSISAILCVVMGFITAFFNDISTELLECIFKKTNLLYKKSKKCIPKYFYYKATKAIKMIMAANFFKRKSKPRKGYNYRKKTNQLTLFDTI